MSDKSETKGEKSESKNNKNTVFNYDEKKITFKSGVRPFGGDDNPYVRFRQKGKTAKKDLAYTVKIDRAVVSNWWKRKFDNYAKRTVIIKFPVKTNGWKKYYPKKKNESDEEYDERMHLAVEYTKKGVVPFFEKMTKHVNGLKDSKLESLKCEEDYEIKNPLWFDDDEEAYLLLATVNIKPGKDPKTGAKLSAYTVEHRNIEGKASMAKLQTNGYIGTITAMSFEIKGKTGKSRFEVHLYEAIAGKFFETEFRSNKAEKASLSGEFDDEDEAAEAIMGDNDDEIEISDESGSEDHDDKVKDHSDNEDSDEQEKLKASAKKKALAKKKDKDETEPAPRRKEAKENGTKKHGSEETLEEDNGKDKKKKKVDKEEADSDEEEVGAGQEKKKKKVDKEETDSDKEDKSSKKKKVDKEEADSDEEDKSSKKKTRGRVFKPNLALNEDVKA